MKSKISVYLSEHVAACLDVAAKRPGATKSSIVEAALDCYLNPERDTPDNVMISGCLGSIRSQLADLDRDLKIVSETVALHARYHFTITPPLPIEEQSEACVLGRERFEVLAAQVEKRVAQGTPLIRETIERLNRMGPDFLPCGPGGTQRSARFANPEPRMPASIIVGEGTERTAAAWEGGSNGGFPGR